MHKHPPLLLIMLTLLSALLAGCGGLVAVPDSRPAPEEGVTPAPVPPTEEPAKGDEEGLEALGGGLEWRRVGGIAGFCDLVIVDALGATVSTCRTEPPEIRANLTLTAAQAKQVQSWLDALAPFEHEQSDGAVADGMTITLTFAGQGTAQPTADDIAAMEALVMELLRTTSDG